MSLNKYIFQHCIKKYLFELILEIMEVLKSILKTEVTEHKGQDVILISFPYDKTLIEELKQALPAKWSASKKAWYVPDRQHFRSLFNLPPKTVGKNALLAISKTNQPALSKLQEQLHLKGYSENTIKVYSLSFAQLLYTLKDHPVDSLSYEQLRSYLLYCKRDLKVSETQIHSRINAIKFYFEQVLQQDKFLVDLPRPKKGFQLPKVLSVSDVRKMLDVTINLKHKLILKIAYGMGLRVSEIVNLKITDIDSKRMQVLIKRSKGKKDRYVNLPDSLLEDLRTYYIEYKPKKYLFEGAYVEQYSIRSAQEVFKSALKKAGIKKPVGIHSLRHSYATHILENGTDIYFIKELLGHNDIKTTQRYLHIGKKEISRVRSPLDDL